MSNDSKAFQVIVNLDVFEMYDALVSKKKMQTKPNMESKKLFSAPIKVNMNVFDN